MKRNNQRNWALGFFTSPDVDEHDAFGGKSASGLIDT